MSEKKPSIGLVGCGNWGKHILRDLVSLGCSVHVVARSAASVANAQAGGSTSIVDSIDKLPALNGAVVASHTNTHFEVINQLLPRGIPIFVEKPLTASVTQLEALRPHAQWLFVMDKWRYHPGVLELTRLVKSSELGELHSIYCKRWGWKSKWRDTDAVWYLAPHDLAIILEILGKVPELEFARLDYYENEVSGCLAVLGRSPRVQLDVSERRESHARQIRIHGSRAIAILSDGYSSHVDFYQLPDSPGNQPSVHRQITISDEMPLYNELKMFLDYLQGGPPPKSNFQDAALVINTIQQIHDAGAR